VGRTERLAVVEIEGTRYVLLNPEVIAASAETAKAEEGCLSIPEVFADVERPVSVTVRAMDLDGQTVEIPASDLLARCFQHEIDHLHGKLFIDHLGMFKRRQVLAKWERLKSDYPTGVRTLTPGEDAERPAGG
jgi:peptide deformylase